MAFGGVVLFLVPLAAFLFAATTLFLLVFHTKGRLVVSFWGRRGGAISTRLWVLIIQRFGSLGLVRVVVLVPVLMGMFSIFDFLKESLHERFNGFVKIHQNDVDYVHANQNKSFIPEMKLFVKYGTKNDLLLKAETIFFFSRPKKKVVIVFKRKSEPLHAN